MKKQKKIKILHVLDSLTVGGAEKVALDLCTGLNTHVTESCVLAFKDGELRDDFEKHGIGVAAFGPRNVYDILFFIKLCALIKKENIDIVHAVTSVPVVNYSLMAAVLMRVKKVVSCHGHNNFSKTSAGFRVWKNNLKFFDKVVAVADSVAAVILEQDVNPSKIIRIYNGIDKSVMSLDAKEKKRLRIELKINESVQTILCCVANLRPIKGHKYLLEAFKQVLKSHDKCCLLLIGAGNLEDKLKDQAQSLGVTSNVIFTGRRSDVSDCLNLADIFVLSSLSEAMPISILEAMRGGLPVVAPKVGGIPEMIEHGSTGLLVQKADSTSLAQALMKLVEDPLLRRRMGGKGKAVFEDCFTKEIFINNYEKMFLDLMGRG